MTEPRMTIQPPRDHGGRFAAYRSEEAADVTLPAETGRGVGGGDARSLLRREVQAQVETLVSFRSVDGGHTTSNRIDDVEYEVRLLLPHLDQEQFDDHMAQVAAAAERASMMEHAIEDPYDTAAWEPIARSLGVEAEDHRPEPGSDTSDIEAHCASTLEAAHEQVERRVAEIVAADEAAYRPAGSQRCAACGGHAGHRPTWGCANPRSEE